MAQLLIHSFSSHIFSQGMGCAIAATVSAGMAGQGTHVKSGWEQSTEEERRLVLETGGLAARSNQSTSASRHHPPPPEEEIKHGCYSAYRFTGFILMLYWLQIILIKLGVVGVKETITM